MRRIKPPTTYYSRVSAVYFGRAKPSKPPSHGMKDPYPCDKHRPAPSSQQPDLHTPASETSQNQVGIDDTQPDEWQPVQDPSGSGGIYWHNPRTGQTTPVGWPKPEKASNVLKFNLLWGAGMAVAFGHLGRIFGGF